MILLSLLLAAGFATGGTGDGTRLALLLRSAHSSSIPAWARKYNMNCSGCHLAAVPRLNATGVQFKWAGYRMPEEIGEDAKAQQVSNYIAVRTRFRYEYDKLQGEPAQTSEFQLPDASLFYAGAFGKNFGGFFELAKEDEAVEFGSQVVMVWGKERSHGGFRVGKTHMLLNSGLAGLDRPIGIAAPTPVAGPITNALPFSFAGDQAGIEAFYVVGRNRIGAQLLGGTQLSSDGLARLGKTKDFVLSDQLLLDSKGSGVMGSAYFGSVGGVDAQSPDLTSRFWRLALTANKIISNFEVLGGVVIGKDLNLPVGGSAEFTAPDQRGIGYWVSGQYTFPGPTLTLFSRYEFVDPDTKVNLNGNRRFVAGGVLPVNLPEYLRFAVEFRRDMPQEAAALRRSNLALEMMLSF